MFQSLSFSYIYWKYRKLLILVLVDAFIQLLWMRQRRSIESVLKRGNVFSTSCKHTTGKRNSLNLANLWGLFSQMNISDPFGRLGELMCLYTTIHVRTFKAFSKIVTKLILAIRCKNEGRYGTLQPLWILSWIKCILRYAQTIIDIMAEKIWEHYSYHQPIRQFLTWKFSAYRYLNNFPQLMYLKFGSLRMFKRNSKQN